LDASIGPILAGKRRNSGISGKFPVKSTGNFFARNREFSFVEQGIQFRGTGNSKRRKRNLRCKWRDCAHRLHQQRENRMKLQGETGWERADAGVTVLFCTPIGLR
jgi:hypothetical protein